MDCDEAKIKMSKNEGKNKKLMSHKTDDLSGCTQKSNFDVKATDRQRTKDRSVKI